MHAKDCAEKLADKKADTSEATSQGTLSTYGASAAQEIIRLNSGKVRTEQDVVEDLRACLVEWQRAGAMQSPEEVNDVLGALARSSGLEIDKIRMLWHTVARQARHVGAPVSAYVELALKHHSVKTEVVDLGQFSADHSNSCMFLTCAAAISDRRLRGFADAELPGWVGQAIAEASPEQQTCSIEDLIEWHRKDRRSMLGCVADALRFAACEVLAHDRGFFLPYFHPISGDLTEQPPEEAYDKWLANLRGNEEGDELAMLALSQICGMAIQPVQQSGYRVPLMDPCSAAEDDCIVYWGNDDKHWVWLRVLP